LKVKSPPGIESDNNDKPKESECAATGCSERGTMRLKLRFVNKWLSFCDRCGKSLIKDELVNSESLHLGVGKGKIVERKEPLTKEGNI
jgi:hypothetical protein